MTFDKDVCIKNFGIIEPEGYNSFGIWIEAKEIGMDIIITCAADILLI